MGFGPWIFRSCRANHAACVEAGRTNRIIGANVIPAQMAGKIARDAGLADQSGYCPIDPESMKSKVDANIFVVGDAAIPGDMPKSAFAANSQAKVAAMVIRAELTQSRAFPARYSNTCWSLIAPDDDIKIGASYEPGEGKIKQITGFVSQKGEPADVRKQSRSTGITALWPMFSADQNVAFLNIPNGGRLAAVFALRRGFAYDWRAHMAPDSSAAWPNSIFPSPSGHMTARGR